DSLGAAIGILNIAKSNEVEGHIVFDPHDVNTGIQRIIDAIKQEDDIWQHFVEQEEAEDIVTSRSLIVVVDTHRPALVSNERLIQMYAYRVVIDHHGRVDDFIANASLVYM